MLVQVAVKEDVMVGEEVPLGRDEKARAFPLEGWCTNRHECLVGPRDQLFGVSEALHHPLHHLPTLFLLAQLLLHLVHPQRQMGEIRLGRLIGARRHH